MQHPPLRIVSSQGVANSQNLPTLRAYPYTPTFWYDQAGHLRWTLTISESVVLSAFIGMLVVYTVGCLLKILYTILYVSVLHRNRKTLIDDQVITIGTNTADDPLKLVVFLSKFALHVRQRVFTSRVFYVLLLIGLVYFAGQTVIIFFIGGLILTDPVPTSPGTCGWPKYGNATDNLDNSTAFQSEIALGMVDDHQAMLFQRAAVQFETCTDAGSTISCPGPAGETFSWKVVESEPGYCWFGPDYCLNLSTSRTITQRATLVPSDLGVIRKSPISLTVSVECSHINNSHFESTIGWNSAWNSSYTAYKFGTPPGRYNTVFENDTRIYYPTEALETCYRLDYVSFNVLDLPSEDVWAAPPFLVDPLANPFLTDNTTASSSLFLLFNRISSVWSIFRNDDPLFLTVSTPNPDNFLYYPDRPISTMACRERYELEFKTPDGSVNDTWIVAGPFGYVYNMSTTYEPIQQDVDLLSDMFLFLSGFGVSGALTLMYQSLGVDIINAQKTVNLDGIQCGSPQNVSTRTEVTRWFGVAMLYALNEANVLTSADNDWGFGINPLPDSFYFCDKTLRMSPNYVSVYFGALLLLLLGAAFIAGISHCLDGVLLLASRLFRESTSQGIATAISAKNSHRILQLHRFFVQATSEQRLTDREIPILQDRGPGIAPSYRAEGDKEVDESDENSGRLLPNRMLVGERAEAV